MEKLKIQVLVDNNTYIDRYFVGEPAVSYYIEIDGNRILFDSGYSDVFISNAEKLNIDLGNLTHVVFSHGHNDHTRGIQFLENRYNLSTVELISHPNCFIPKKHGEKSIGAPFSAEEIKNIFMYNPKDKPFNLSKNCVFLGEIPSINNFEKRAKIGKCKIGDLWEDDYVLDDSAIVCKTDKGIFIVTGCSHSGICNIVEYAKKVCGDDRVIGILGGFHLFELNNRLDSTIQYLDKEEIRMLYPCHCVSFKVKAKMNEILNVNEVGVGLTISI
ncbi:MBL fold metallo-hydrolase [Clostridioides difficile]|uniref:MBL fold metallo-hydrolase n=1 Tax=Clostridioides difficile TaxID=1496 RepID=UPI0010BBA67C|nr:MBL fold metallo-hydrolase [Clostridioides difficile]UUC43092.1 MBL fold metallo-hydrolase [Clostridioides difficile]VIF87278.1 metallo-beta-lactamase superfamily protein [Clostridioides difficile]